MPTILFILGWGLYFWSNEGKEPMYAEKGGMECKFWLDIENFDLKIAFEYKLSPQSRREIKKIIFDHFDYIISEWKKYFNE